MAQAAQAVILVYQGIQVTVVFLVLAAIQVLAVIQVLADLVATVVQEFQVIVVTLACLEPQLDLVIQAIVV